MFYCLIWEWEFKNGSMSFEVLFFFHVWLLGKYGKMNEVEFQFWVFNLKMIPKKAKEKKILGFLVLTAFFFFLKFMMKWQTSGNLCGMKIIFYFNY